MARITSEKTRQAILSTDSEWDPERRPESIALFDEEGVLLTRESLTGPPGEDGEDGEPGPQGPPGLPGDAGIIAIPSTPVLDVGMLNQIRAGRQLLPSDFTDLGLGAPAGLWNLSDVNDSSGNGRNLTNKGAVTFDVGINGLATTAARFKGDVAQALYLADTGAADPFRILTGSIGMWFRTPKKGVTQTLMAKASAASWGIFLQIAAGTGFLTPYLGNGGTGSVTPVSPTGNVDITDDRWHFIVMAYDGARMNLYLDGALECTVAMTSPIGASSGPLTIGSTYADAATAGQNPFFGLIDELFYTSDVLTEDQARNFYCAKIAHALGAVPERLFFSVTRRRKGAPLVAGDFPAQPIRLHNFAAGSLANEGSDGNALALNGAGVSVAGPDGSRAHAYSFVGTGNLASTDANLPGGLGARSIGCWFKTSSAAQGTLISWGTPSGAQYDEIGITGAGQIYGPGTPGSIYVNDGLWHFVEAVMDNTAIDGLKTKLYVDGRCVVSLTTMNTIVLAGANRFRIGARPDSSVAFNGQIDSVFVCGYALTHTQLLALYLKSSMALPLSPKNVGDHIEAATGTHLYVVHDSLEMQNVVDLGLAA